MARGPSPEAPQISSRNVRTPGAPRHQGNVTHHDSHEVALQDAWLRRVAKGLISDTDAAEDLVQDAWVASLERGKGGASAQPWLSGVVHNLTFSRFRRRANQRDRERDAHRPSETPPPDEVVEQLQMRERVARELGALEEPYRSALYLRFVEGLSTRAMSKRLGIAPSTVQGRMDKGLALLRMRLDRAYGGDRRAWVTAVLPWARTAAPLAAFSTTTLTMLAITAAASAALVVSCFLPWGGSIAPDSSPPPATPHAESAAESTAELAAIVEPSVPARVAEAVAPHSTAPDPTPTAAAQGDGATVRGRLLLPDGRPAVGATWTLSGFPGNHELVMDHGVPDDWTDPTGTLDDEGRFELSFASPPAFQYALDIDHPDCVGVNWRWGSIAPTETKDIGDVTLRSPGTIEGAVVDSSGTPLTGRAWRVYATEAGIPPDLGLQAAGVIGSTELGSARFTLDRLPDGPVELKIYDRQLGWVDGPRVEVRAGETTVMDFPVLEMEEFADAIVFSFRLIPFHGYRDPAASHIWLVKDDGTRRNAKIVPGRSGFLFGEVGPGTFRVEVDDPRLEPWSQENVEAGAYVHAELRGNAALAFAVTGPGGAAIETFGVDITIEDSVWSPNRFRAVKGDQPLPGGRYGGLLPGDYSVTIEAEGISKTVRVAGLQAGETRPVVAQLSVAEMLIGRVLRPSGEPAAGVLVRSVLPAEVDDSSASFIFGSGVTMTNAERERREVGRVFTDENGAFTLPRSDAAAHIVVAGEHPGPRAESPLLERGAPNAQSLELTLAAGGWIEGTIDVPEGLESFGWMVAFVHPGSPGDAGPPPVGYAHVEDGGVFRLGPLPVGEGTLVLLQAGGGVTAGVIPNHGRILGEVTLVEGETLDLELAYPGEAPVAVTVHLSGFGPAGPGSAIDAAFERAVTGPTSNATSSSEQVGPLQLEPGTYLATFAGEGWLARADGLEFAAGEPAQRQVVLDLSQRSVRFTAGGAPLQNASLRVTGLPQGVDGPTFRTGDDGACDLRLGPGSYTLRIETMDMDRVFLAATVQWPLPAGTDSIAFE